MTTPSDERRANFVKKKQQLIRGVRKAAADWMRTQDPGNTESARVMVEALVDITAIAATSGYDVTREEFQEFCGRSYDEAVEVHKAPGGRMTDKIEKRASDELSEQEQEAREYRRRIVWLREQLPQTVGQMERSGPIPHDNQMRAAFTELYERLDPLSGANRQDIDDTLGEGMADMVETEGDMADGGIFGSGGISAGGIFGEGPVATNLNDPAAEHRTANADATHALLGGGHRPKSLPTEARKALIDDRRRERMLKGRDKKDDDENGGESSE